VFHKTKFFIDWIDLLWRIYYTKLIDISLLSDISLISDQPVSYFIRFRLISNDLLFYEKLTGMQKSSLLARNGEVKLTSKFCYGLVLGVSCVLIPLTFSLLKSD